MNVCLSSLYWKTNKFNSDLFHFQGDDYISSKIQTQSSTHIYLSKDYQQITTKENINSEYLLSIMKNNDHEYYIQRIPHFSKMDLWLVLNYSYTNQVKGHRLREGETIRLGKVQFKIIEAKVTNDKNTPLVTSNNNIYRMPSQRGAVFAIKEKPEIDLNEDPKKLLSTLDFNTIESTNRQSMGSMNHDSYIQFTCRVCFGDSAQDLLINVCNCIGSVKYIHVKCLWRWIITKITFKTHSFLSLYTYNRIQCEICNCDIPEVVMVNNNILYLYQPYNILSAYSEDKEVSYENFLALEHIKQYSDNSNTEEKTLYIINFSEREKLTLGRSKKADVHLVDHSINDVQAELSILDNSIYINDLDSIYGTHLLIEKNLKIPLSIKQALGFQLNSIFINIHLKKTFFWCCSYLFNSKKNQLPLNQKKNKSNSKQINYLTSSNIVEEYFDDEEEKNKQVLTSHQLRSLKNVDVYDKENNTIRVSINETEEEEDRENNNNNNYCKLDKKLTHNNINFRNNKDEERSHIVIHSTLDYLNLEEGVIGSTRMLVKNREITKGTNSSNDLQQNNQKGPVSFNRTLILMNSNRPYNFS